MQCKLAKMIIEEGKINGKLATKEFKINELTLDLKAQKEIVEKRETEVAQLKSTKEQLMVRIDFYKGVFDEEQKERQKIEFEFKQLKATYDELKRQNDIHKQL